jgi:hypothetical protein
LSRNLPTATRISSSAFLSEVTELPNMRHVTMPA